MEVDCLLLWSTAVAVCLGDVSGLSPCFLPFVFFPISLLQPLPAF